MARYRTGIETRARILEATRGLLGDVGLDGTTIKAICERADVQPGSFYNLFESKDEAILAVIADAIAAVDPHPHGAGSDSVSELVDAYLDFVAGQPDLAKIYLQLAVSGGLTDPVLAHRMLGHHHRRVERFSDALLRQSPELTDAQATLKSERLLATLNGLAFVSFLDPEFDLRAHVEGMLPSLV